MSTPVTSVYSNKIGGAPVTGPASKPSQVVKGKGPSFADSLKALSENPALQPQTGVGAAQGLKFSNHAVERMQMRRVSFSPDQLSRIEGVVNKAAAKGAKETLVLTDDAALIVNPKSKTVITVMDKAQLKENVFTKIDSTVMV